MIPKVTRGLPAGRGRAGTPSRCYAPVVVDDTQQPSGAVGEAAAWTSLAYLITGPAVYGGLGWAFDTWWDTGWCTPVGITLGMVAAIYLVLVRYVRS